jgi:hypothetical protein
MLARALVSIFAAGLGVGCLDPELERSTDLAHIEVESLSMYVGSFTMWGDIHPVREERDPCQILGDDFHASVNEIALSAYPGDREEICDGESPKDCKNIARCHGPGVDFSWPPPIDAAELVIADHSRTITCHMGDAFAARTMTRVPDGSWSVTRGNAVTVKVSPASDLSRFVTDVFFAPAGQAVRSVPHTKDGDTVTFRIPSLIPTGPQTLYMHLDGEEAPDCGVPSRALYSYVIEQPINVQ